MCINGKKKKLGGNLYLPSLIQWLQMAGEVQAKGTKAASHAYVISQNNISRLQLLIETVLS